MITVNFEDEEYKSLLEFLNKLSRLDTEYLINKNNINTTDENITKATLRLQKYSSEVK